MNRIALGVLTIVLLLGCVVGAQPQQVALRIEPATALPQAGWPVSVGVPLPQGLLTEVSRLRVVDDQGHTPAYHFSRRNTWRDGSAKWTMLDLHAQPGRAYAVVVDPAAAPASPALPQMVQVKQGDDGNISIHTGGAAYTFTPGHGWFDSLTLAGQPVVQQGGDACYVVDLTGRRATLRAEQLWVDSANPMHAVVGIAGAYRTEQGAQLAGGRVYFHFFAGLPWVKVSHKLIVTEDGNQIGFADIGIRVPLQPRGAAQGNFNHDDADPAATTRVALTAPVTLTQRTYPHFAKTDSLATLTQAGQTVKQTTAAGDWALWQADDLNLAVQLPRFAQTFPKALTLAPDHLEVKLWAGAETGQKLDFRTEALMRDYFGNDWIPADHAVAKAPNQARGIARTHDLWLCPGVPADFIPAAGRGGVLALPDANWINTTGVMGHWQPYDPQQFPGLEAYITDYYQRGVQAPNLVFPSTGFLHDGMYPYSQQPWEIKHERWYPTIHRLSRCLEYNLKRHVWILAARGGPRHLFDYARRFSRFMHDIGFSNSNAAPDTGVRPSRGRLYQNTPFDSPIVWGGESHSHLAWASSEDVIQFVYDYLLTGDLHSRDMVRWWIEAVGRDLDFNVDRAIKEFYPSVVFLRILGSAYELESDPKLYDFGHAILQRTVDADNEVGLNPGARQNLGKAGDTFSVFYYYYVSTGDELALIPMHRLAEFDYRWARFDFLGRSSAQAYAYSLALRAKPDAGLQAYLADHLRHTATTVPTLQRLGVDFASLNQQTATPYGHLTLTGSGPIFNGLPVALAALRAREPGFNPEDPDLLSLPVASKLIPSSRTHLLLRKADASPVELDLHVHNWGHRDSAFKVRLLNEQGAEQPLEILEEHFHREMGPPTSDGDAWALSPWYYQFESQYAYRLRLPGQLPPGVYELDSGEQVSFTVKRSTATQMLQVAPQGIPLERDIDYYFQLPPDQPTLSFFAHRPVHVYDSAGQEVTQKPIGEGRFEVALSGPRDQPWRICTGTDDMTTDSINVDTFLRFLDAPLVIAQGSPRRLFAVDAARFAGEVQPRLPSPTKDAPFVPSFSAAFGQAAALYQHYVEVPLTGPEAKPAATDELSLEEPGAAAKMTQTLPAAGTVEFWFRPLWSSTDLAMPTRDRSTQRGQYFNLDPVTVNVFTDPDNSGRTGRYNICRLDVEVKGLGNFPSQFMAEAGRWQHLAVCWRADGQNSYVRVFIDGREKSYYHYRPIDPKTPADKVAPLGALLKLGSAHFYNRAATGEHFDELRVSQGERYTGDFTPATAPFTPDAQTLILMHFDGNLTVQGAAATTAQIKSGSRLK